MMINSEFFALTVVKINLNSNIKECELIIGQVTKLVCSTCS